MEVIPVYVGGRHAFNIYRVDGNLLLEDEIAVVEQEAAGD